jgi:hypothetical protein
MEKAKKIIGLICISIGIGVAIVFWFSFGFASILDTTVWEGLNLIKVETSWAILLGCTTISGAILISGTGKE